MLRDDPASILHLYRRMLACRRGSPALRLGDMVIIDAVPPDVLAWERSYADDRRLVLVNFGDEPADVGGVAGTDDIVEVASDGIGEGSSFTGRVGPAQALVLRSTR